eukprot:6754787-Pyramimonas_sp.AAC.1
MHIERSNTYHASETSPTRTAHPRRVCSLGHFVELDALADLTDGAHDLEVLEGQGVVGARL